MNRIAKYENPFSTLVKDVFGFWDPWNMAGPAQHTHYTQENISCDEAGYTIKLVLPGIPKEQLSVKMKNNILYIDREGKQLRGYLVPENTDSGAITAELSDGVLTIKVPQKVHPVIKIQVK